MYIDATVLFTFILYKVELFCLVFDKLSNNINSFGDVAMAVHLSCAGFAAQWISLQWVWQDH